MMPKGFSNSQRRNGVLRWCSALGLAAFATAACQGQQPAAATGIGIPYDWSHHHLVFSQPATVSDALTIERDPRYWHQWYRRNGLVAVPESDPGADKSKRPPMHKDWSANMGSGAKVGAGNYPAKYSFYPSNASCSSDFVVFNSSLRGTSGQASIGAYTNLYSGCPTGAVPSVSWAYNTSGTISTSVVLSYFGDQVAFMHLETITMSKNATATATGVALTIGGATGFVGNTTSGSPLVTLTAGTLGSSSQAITGSGIPTTTTVSAIASASLNILRWSSSTTQTFAAPAAPTSAAASSYFNCTAPCMTSISFSTPANDTNSSPFYDYANDILYVGDDNGGLHKFQHVFKSTSGNPPAEVTVTWPVTMTAGSKLTSPVFDGGASQKVFVGDSGGFLYSVSANGATRNTSAQVAKTGSKGIVDGPLVDSSQQTVYVFVGQDPFGTTCANGTNGCNGVFQFQTGFTSGSPLVESAMGVGTAATVIYGGAFDNTYYSNPPHGNLYVCGANGIPQPKLEGIPISSNTSLPMIASDLIKPLVSGSGSAGCSSVTEVYNTATSTDWIFLSVTAGGNLTGCAGACLYNFNVTSTPPSCSPTCTFTATAGIAAASGTSGIVIDNTVGSGTFAGASQVYFSTLAAGSCGGGCAVQASQAALQ